MWLPGHVAVGLLLSLALMLVGLRRGERLVTLLACMAFFSVLPDYLHLEGLRTFSHSFLGAGLMLAAGIVLLTAFLGWRPWLVMVAAVSLASHLLADAYIGHIYPWYPWSLEIVQHNQFNTLFDVRVEVGLSMVAAVPL
ncbi:MAG: metal-dependent hydrolase, partial [Methanomassiliicoccales archaeon]|nr:metal-dependent hydrolase [Methanomassiliicoccales archaeon]